MQNHFFNAYEILDVNPSASNAEIKRAYKLKAQEFHPDKHNNSKPANAMFKLIVQAKDLLMDSVSRLQHDYALGIKIKPTPKPEPEVIYINKHENETDWGPIIGAGLIGLALGVAIRKRQKRKIKK